MEHLTRLGKNVLREEVAGFLILPAVFVAAAWYFLPSYPATKIAVYSLVVATWSLFFPVRIGALPKNAADFWYYALAGVGVVLFFANAGTERQKISLAEEFNIRHSEYATFVERKPAVIALFDDPHKLLRIITTNARERAANLASKELAAICAQLMADQMRDNQERMDDPKRRDLDLRLPSIDLQECNNRSWQPTLEQLAAVQTLDKLASFLSSPKVDGLEGMIGMGVGPLSLREVGRYLSKINAGNSIKTQLDEEEREKKLSADKLRDEYKDIGRVLQPGGGGGWPAIQYFLWPYLVLAALGLKLARVQYAGPDAVDPNRA